MNSIMNDMAEFPTLITLNDNSNVLNANLITYYKVNDEKLD
jgi:hypothetical protein